jgi:hypothetical protein
VAAGPAAYATPSQSPGRGARARHALPLRYRRTAAWHGRQRPPGIGVPVSIWPHAPVPGSGPGPGSALCASCTGSGPDAAQIITAFSRPGELVVIPGARDGVMVAAAAAAGRRVLA